MHSRFLAQSFQFLVSLLRFGFELQMKLDACLLLIRQTALKIKGV